MSLSTIFNHVRTFSSLSTVQSNETKSSCSMLNTVNQVRFTTHNTMLT